MNALLSINSQHRYYVVKAGDNLSYLDFMHAANITIRIARWLGRTDLVPDEHIFGTSAGYDLYQEAVRAGSEHHAVTKQRCPADLVDQLVGLEGKRVEVIDRTGDKRRFWVGRTAGWMPAHLEIARRGSMGGMIVCGAPFREVRVVSDERI